MVLAEWNRSFILGVEPMDEDHERLVSLLNNCYRALMLDDQHHQVATIVNELRDYACYHFEAEKKLMLSGNYPEADSHLEQHDQFTNSVRNFKERFQAHDSYVALDILSFLNGWLINHIQKNDRDLASFLRAKGVA